MGFIDIFVVKSVANDGFEQNSVLSNFRKIRFVAAKVCFLNIAPRYTAYARNFAVAKYDIVLVLLLHVYL